MILKLVWRNLWRNPRRTAITVASIAFAVVLAVLLQSIQKGTFDNLIKNVVGYYSGYIQLHQKGYWEEQVLDNSFAYNDTLAAHLQQHPEITGVVPRLETFILASGAGVSKGCLLVGTDPEQENAFTRLEKKLVDGRYFRKDEAAVLLSEGLAQRLDVQVQDTLVLFGQGYQGVMAAGKYPVAGIVRLAAPAMNNAFVYLPLAEARLLLSAENRLTSLVLNLNDPAAMEPIGKALRERIDTSYEVMSWKQMMPEIETHIKADGVSAVIFSAVLYLIIGFGFFGTVLMMTAERRFEFGMLIAIGMKKMRLGMILLCETIALSLTGVVAGLSLSLPLVVYLKHQPIRFRGNMAEAWEQFGFEPVMPTEVDPAIFFNQSVLVLCLSLLIGLYPLWHIHRLNAVKAMKR